MSKRFHRHRPRSECLDHKAVGFVASINVDLEKVMTTVTIPCNGRRPLSKTKGYVIARLIHGLKKAMATCASPTSSANAPEDASADKIEPTAQQNGSSLRDSVRDAMVTNIPLGLHYKTQGHWLLIPLKLYAGITLNGDCTNISFKDPKTQQRMTFNFDLGEMRVANLQKLCHGRLKSCKQAHGLLRAELSRFRMKQELKEMGLWPLRKQRAFADTKEESEARTAMVLPVEYVWRDREVDLTRDQ